MLLYLALNKVDVYLGLAAGGDAMKQGYLLLHHRHEYLVVGSFLGIAQLLDELGMGLAPVVQASHLHLVGFEHTTLDEHRNGLEGGVRGIHQFLAGYFSNLVPRTLYLAPRYLIPSRQGKELDEAV